MDMTQRTDRRAYGEAEAQDERNFVRPEDDTQNGTWAGPLVIGAIAIYLALALLLLVATGQIAEAIR